jgi:diguanylate cyclase (GGDEF)-like protein
MSRASPCSAHQLAEFLTAVSAHTEELGAIECAVDLSSAALEAEVGAVVWNGTIAAAIGFPRDQVPCEAIIAAATRCGSFLEVPGVGPCGVVAVPLGVAPLDAALVVARSGDSFGAEELSMLRAMASVLSLTLRQVRNALASVEERRNTLKQLSMIQRSISLRAPLQDVLDAVTRGAASVLCDDIVTFFGVDPDDPERLWARSTFGTTPELDRDRRLGVGAVGRAIFENRLVVINDYPSWHSAQPDVVEVGVQAAMAAPVHQHGQVVGCLVVGSRRAGRVYTVTEQELLVTFAENASLAVTDAMTVDALHVAVDDALHQALHDPLTGLANRARFLDRFDHALTVRRRAGVEVAVLCVDVDDFKLINDRLGHAEGDRLLIEVGMRILGAVRSGDTVARVGADEFAVLLENASGVAEAERTAIRIIEEIAKPIKLGGNDVSATVSIGLAVAGADAAGSNDVLRNADVAMVRAKNAGKARVVTFEAEMYETLLERIELEADLRRAIDDGDLEVYFQPIVNLATEQVVGVEALSRWCHPTRGFVPPSTFIPLAEETGLIVELGRGVLNQACSWIGTWQRAHADEPLFYVSVNLSARQLQQPELTAEVERALAGGMAPGCLVLELTESVLMQDTETTLSRLHELKSLGVRLALDDFGTGYSSLSYLRRFPVDLLKIDRSFVSGLEPRNDLQRLVAAIVALGGTLGLESVAEGIEELEELEALRTVGCRFGQGFYFAKPMPVSDLERYLSGALSRT